VKDGVTNLSASVHARLLNKARAENRPFQELLRYYAMERFLHRLARSTHADSFVLKGALMLQFWGAELTRSTKDIDLLGRGPSEVEALVSVVRDCLATDVEADGLEFDPGTVIGQAIRIAVGYAGVRLAFPAKLGKARIPLQLDVGFGDVMTPGPSEIVYPCLLGAAEIRLLGYAPETAIAEKFEAMVSLDLANSRLKDYFDIWMISRSRAFAGEVLADAIAATFARRGTEAPTATPLGLTAAFAEAPGKQAQWTSWLRSARIEDGVPPLAAVVADVRAFLEPVVTPLAQGGPPPGSWRPRGPWDGGAPGC